jgi:hypothetical protein
MRINSRTLIVSLLAGLIVVCGCVAVYFFSTRSLLTGAAPPPSEGEPPAVAATESLPSELPTLVAPEPVIPSPQPALPEQRYLTLEYPPRIRAGDSDLIRLTLEVDDLGNLTPTAEIGDHVVTGKVVEIPNLYESHHVIAEARFDIAGMEIQPTELMSEPLAQGNMATFYWSIQPREVGLYRGTIWLYLRFVDKQSGEESRKTISAQIVEIEAVNLLGLSGGVARTTGVIGSILGTMIGFPFFEDIIKFLFKRRIKSK